MPTTPVPADLDLARVPRHVAVIMDGNGRWAKERGLPRIAGHRAGVEAVRRTLAACEALGVGVITLFSFSTENWKRPEDEVRALMGLLTELVGAETEGLVARGIRLRVIGRRAGLPEDVRAAVSLAEERTSGCTGPVLCLALNYGARAEIVDAARSIADDVRAGTLDPAGIDEGAIERRLYTAGLPDPDLLIRTSGELRVSNFLLWQISYAELHVTPVRWPDFSENDFYAAVQDYQSRDRRFGDHADRADRADRGGPGTEPVPSPAC